MFNLSFSFFFFNDTATTEIYTLSLHDALPICNVSTRCSLFAELDSLRNALTSSGEGNVPVISRRSEEHTSELQSQSNLVCRLLLEKKKKKETRQNNTTNCSAEKNSRCAIGPVS